MFVYNLVLDINYLQDVDEFILNSFFIFFSLSLIFIFNF